MLAGVGDRFVVGDGALAGRRARRPADRGSHQGRPCQRDRPRLRSVALRLTCMNLGRRPSASPRFQRGRGRAAASAPMGSHRAFTGFSTSRTRGASRPSLVRDDQGGSCARPARRDRPGGRALRPRHQCVRASYRRRGPFSIVWDLVADQYRRLITSGNGPLLGHDPEDTAGLIAAALAAPVTEPPS